MAAKISAQKWIDGQIRVLADYKEMNPHSDEYTVVETHKQQGGKRKGAGRKPAPARKAPQMGNCKACGETLEPWEVAGVCEGCGESEKKSPEHQPDC
ncbi:MAG: hypothetical protein ACO20Y_08080 [Poseidonia sp.]